MLHSHHCLTEGLALSGGGARGTAHIGVLKVLERECIPIDFVAGTSMGGVIAAGCAAGLGAEYMEREAVRMGQLRNLLGLLDHSLSGPGLVNGGRILRYFAQHLGEMSFDELAIPLALVAADLERGEEVILQSGSVVEAIRATVSMPGLFTPFRTNGRLLVDGGVTNPLPVDIVRRMGADVVIAVDVLRGFESLSSLSEAIGQALSLTRAPLVIEILIRSLSIMQKQICALKTQEAAPEVLIRPALSSEITPFGGSTRVRECIAAGEKATELALPHLCKLLGRRKTTDHQTGSA